MKVAVALTALIIATSVGISHAAHPLITDDTGTQGTKKFSLEINTEIGRSAGDGVRETTTEVAATLSAGLAENIDLVVGLPFQTLRVEEDGEVTDEEGIADMSVEVKWRFFEKDGLTMAFKPGISIPTGSAARGLGNGKVSYAGTFIVTQEVKPFTLHANLGYTRNEFSDNDGTARKNILSASLAAAAEVANGLQVVTNIGAESNAEAGNGMWPIFGLAGIIYGITDNIDVDCGIKAGLNKAEPDVTVLAGLAIRF